MIFRCPYCRTTLGEPPPPTCPKCGKTMQIPEHLQPDDERKRRAARRRARRIEELRGDRQPGQQSMSTPELLLTKRPAIMAGLLMLIVAVSFLLGGRSVAIRQQKVKPRRSHLERAMTDLITLRIALERFRWDCRRYPTTHEGLHALVRDDNFIGWRGHYVNMVRPDPWGERYIYRFDGETMILFSKGPDKKEGTADDIVPADPTDEQVAGPGEYWHIRGEWRPESTVLSDDRFDNTGNVQ